MRRNSKHSTFVRQSAKAALITAALAASTVASAQSASTQSMTAEYAGPNITNAENIRGLNIMLMVTSLRCRVSGHDFRSEYGLFTAAHRQNLAAAHDRLTQDFAATYGEEGSARALDRIGVAIANQYGDGHPTMGCSQLKEATLELAMNQDRAQLASMAARLLEGKAASAANEPRQSPANIPQPIERPEPVAVDSADLERPGVDQVPNWLRG